ncbi:MAG: dihydropteroate synthase [Rhodospirillaceae bacterium]
MANGPGEAATPHSSLLTPHRGALLRAGRFHLDLSRPLIMGVVNVTPDSFSDGGRHVEADAAVSHAHRLLHEGADILDIGGESTRPGAHPVPLEEERRRVLPVLEALTGVAAPVSVDTRTPALMREVIAAGASMINDISALEGPEALEIVAQSDVTVCLMHKQGEPQTMQDDPVYADVVGEVTDYLQRRIEAARAAGIADDRIVVDPGFGFGKTLEHNLELLRSLHRIASLGAPVLAGLSRKGMLGRITGRSVDDRIHASVAAALIAVQNGARIVRVHDVAATRDALRVWTAVAAG